MKKLFAILTALLLILSASACSKNSTPQPGVKLRHAEITVKNYGTIKLELDAGTAPITV